MFRKTIKLSFILVVLISTVAHSQVYQCNLEWKSSGKNNSYHSNISEILSFEDCVFDEDSGLPYFSSRFALAGNHSKYEARLKNKIFVPLSKEEVTAFAFLNRPDTAIQFLEQELTYTRKEPFIYISLLPFRQNPSNRKLEKLVSFQIEFIGCGNTPLKAIREYATESVLAAGDWYKISTSKHGVHKITFEDLSAAGLNLQGVSPDKIRLFGNGGAMLPEQNDLPRVSDLRELAIEVVTSNPGVFGQSDFILFFAPSPHTWKPATTSGNHFFEYNKNVYSDFAYYFITISDSPGMRINNGQLAIEPANYNVNSFNDFAVYKPDQVNIAGKGRQWFGDKIYGGTQPYAIPGFHFPNIDSAHPVFVRARFAVWAAESSRIKLIINGQEFESSNIPKPNNYWVASASVINSTLSINKDYIDVAVNYINSNSAASAWTDYVELNLKRHLIYTSGQFGFRNLTSVGPDRISKFNLKNPFDDLIIWDVSNIPVPELIQYTDLSDALEFIVPTNSLREFIAFTHSDAHSIHNIELISNQNLHGLEAYDMIIISPEVFLYEAENYAQFRRESSELSILVVSLEEIYNEFASGSPDLTAIRDFMKMLYDRAPSGSEPKYLLLFGDGSYDPKDRIPNNNNFIPTYQSVESLKLDLTFVTDDYYGLLDDGKGLSAAGSLDIGIGRFPVNSTEQARNLQNKIRHYILNQEKTAGSWQNTVTFVAHDEDSDVHFIQAEELASYLNNHHPVFSLGKIYLDAYQRVLIPGGYRYPEANSAINKSVDEGTLLINYIGHGGETGWANSKVLTVADVNSWQNIDNMPVFITATCSFGRFDNPEQVSAGEMVVMNPNGGGIALFTTSRLAYSAFNQMLNRSLTRFFFERRNGTVNTLGETMMKSKNDNNNNLFIRNFLLLGDPSLKPALPGYNVVTTSINGQDLEGIPNLSAMSKVTVTGYIEDHYTNKLTGFNGTLYPVVYDKSIKFYTNANHPSSSVRPFYLQNTILYSGKVSVTDGDFAFSFVMPRNINPSTGSGKISYYATNGQSDANGYFDEFLIGGYNPEISDDSGPEIKLFINEPGFSFGDPTHESPLLIANLSDESGINFFGLGIGQDIVAFLNDDTQNPIPLNDFFEPDLDSHTSGIVKYRFRNLPEGRHSLRLRAFDINNNSSVAYTEFIVTSSLEIATGDLKNYPNPFSDGTHFTFRHNYYDQDVNVAINIFDLTGQMVKTIGPLNLQSSGSAVEPLYWNGTGQNGHKLHSGIYIYQIRLETNKGNFSTMQNKLMIIR